MGELLRLVNLRERNDKDLEGTVVDQNIWVAALTGGAAGAILTRAMGLISNFLNRPRLRITFDRNERGCIVDTPAAQVTDAGLISCTRRRARMLFRLADV
jgi:hypothetical protein